MRRKDRQMDEAFALDVIDKSDFGVLSMNGDTEPLSVPLSLVRDGRTLYFHSARDGQKVVQIHDGQRVSLTFVSRVRVPELYTIKELEELASQPSEFHQLVSRVFTTEFESAIVTGVITEVLDDETKEHALKLVCQKYTPTKMDYFRQARDSGMKLTRVYRIEMDQVTGKRKKYASDGHELKYMEQETE